MRIIHEMLFHVLYLKSNLDTDICSSFVLENNWWNFRFGFYCVNILVDSESLHYEELHVFGAKVFQTSKIKNVLGVWCVKIEFFNCIIRISLHQYSYYIRWNKINFESFVLQLWTHIFGKIYSRQSNICTIHLINMQFRNRTCDGLNHNKVY